MNDEKRGPKSIEQVDFELDTAPEIVRATLGMGSAVSHFLNDKYLAPIGEGMSENQLSVVAATLASAVDYDTAMFLLEGTYIAPDILELIGAWHKKRAEVRSRDDK